MDVNSIDYGDPLNNSYLIDCAISVTISGPSPVSGESKNQAQRSAEKKKKTMIADFLLSQEFDLNFKNKHGDPLLASVISSFLPDEWKEKTVQYLIKKGADISARTASGDTAMDIAKHKGHAKIIKILSNN